MQKKLIKCENNLALILDQPILDLLNIDVHTPLEISTDGQVLIVAPKRDELREKNFSEALKCVNEKYGRALKRLTE